MRKLLPGLLLIFAWAATLVAQTLSPDVRRFVTVDAPVVALTHVRVIDGTGAAAREDQTVVISKGKIESVSDGASANVPKDAKVLDLHGYSVIPGLVGMHDHFFYPMGNGIFGEMAFSFPRLYLAGGVTTIRTTGSLEPYTDLELKRQIDRGETPGPKVHVTGPYLEGPGTFAVQMHQLTGPDDAAKTVNFWLDQGVDNFKAYMFITPAELSAAVDAAHKRGAKVAGHLCSIGFREAAAIGIDDLEHGLLVDTEFYSWKKPGECPEKSDYDFISKLDVQSGPLHDTILDLVQHHVAVTSTLPVFEMFVPGRPTIQQRVLDALTADARSAVLNNKVRAGDASAIRQRYHTDSPPWPAAFKKEMEFEHAFAQAGGCCWPDSIPPAWEASSPVSAISAKSNCWSKRASHRWRPFTLRPPMAPNFWESWIGSAPSVPASRRTWSWSKATRRSKSRTSRRLRPYSKTVSATTQPS